MKGLHALQYMEEYLKQIKVRKIEKIPYDPHNVISQLTVLKKKIPLQLYSKSEVGENC